jgi:hypothetical protein
LRELQTTRPVVIGYEEYVQREKEQDQKERENWQGALDLQKERTALAEEREKLQKEKADLMESLYNACCKKKPGGFKCFLKRFFTAGLSRC